MEMLGMLSQTIVYLCFAILMGGFILAVVPETARPSIHVPKWALLISTIGLALFSFFPVLHLLFYLVPNMGFTDTLQSVLFTFKVGKAWFFTFIVSIILFLFIALFDNRDNRFYCAIAIALTFLLIPFILLL